MIPEYKYQVIDNSLLTPFFKERMVKPFFRFVPWWLPANVITIGSNIFMVGALLIALFEVSSIHVRLISAAVLIMLYAIGDHLDGMQAKRTRTSSALGEFFDHFLDAFNTGILLVTVLILFGITDPGVFAFVLVTSYLAHASMIFEQYKTGWLIFDKIGSLEALLFTCFLLLISSIPAVYQLMTTTRILNLNIIEMLVIVTALFSMVTLVKTIIRARITELMFYLFCFLFILTATLSMLMFANLLIFMVIALYAAYYIGNLMRGHLADRVTRLPDFLIPVILVAGLLGNLSGYSAYKALIFTYLSFVIIRLAYGTVFTLRRFWVWKNPMVEDVEYQPYHART